MKATMKTNPRVSRTRLLAVSLGPLLMAAPLMGADAKLPPINPYPRHASLTGKFIWHDLVTDDVKAAKRFYHDVLGWECKTLGTSVDAYTIIRQGGRAIGGIVFDERPASNQNESQWIGFISVPDVRHAGREVRLQGGKTVVAPAHLSGRGEYALFADAEGALFAVCHSSSGDPPDYQPQIDQWLWAERWSADPPRTAKFYQEVGGYSLRQNLAGPDRATHHLWSRGFGRAGIVPIPDSRIKAGWLYYVRVKDVLQTVAKARAHGGRVLLEPDANSKAGRVAVIEDPTGAPLGLAEWSPTKKEKE